LSEAVEARLAGATRTGGLATGPAALGAGRTTHNGLSTDAIFCAGLILASALFFIANAYLLVSGKPANVADLDAANTSDFFVYFSAARMALAEGSTTQLYDFEGFRAFQATLTAVAPGYHPFVYPPTYLLAILPLGLLPYAASFAAWEVLTLVALILAARLAGLRAIEVAAVALAPACTINFAAGQNGFLTSALLIAGLTLMQRRPAWAGGFFGLLTIKFHLGLLLPVTLVAQRNWAAILCAIGAAAALIGLSLLTFGPESWVAYVDFTQQFQQVAVTREMQSLAANAISPLIGAAVAGVPLPVAYALQAVVTVAVAALVYRCERRLADAELRLAVLLTATTLVLPYGFFYDIAFLTLPIVILARRGLRDGFHPYERPVLAAAWLLPLFASHLQVAGLPAAPLVHLAVFLLVLRRALSDVKVINALSPYNKTWR